MSRCKGLNDFTNPYIYENYLQKQKNLFQGNKSCIFTRKNRVAFTILINFTKETSPIAPEFKNYFLF